MIVVQLLCGPGGMQTPHDGRFVKSWDANTEYGTLAVTSTDKIAEARRFPSIIEVHAEWAEVSRVQPRRPDGELNRPLAGMSLHFLSVTR